MQGGKRLEAISPPICPLEGSPRLQATQLIRPDRPCPRLRSSPRPPPPEQPSAQSARGAAYPRRSRTLSCASLQRLRICAAVGGRRRVRCATSASQWAGSAVDVSGAVGIRRTRSARWRASSPISSLWRPCDPYCSTTSLVGSHASRCAHARPLHITTTRASARRGNARGLTHHTACARARARCTHAMHDGRTARAARADARGRRGARTGAQNTWASRHTGRHREPTAT